MVVPVVVPAVLGGGPEVLVRGWRAMGWERLSSRKAVVRSAALASLNGMGRPWAVLDTRETNEVLGWDKGGSGNREEDVNRDDESGPPAGAGGEVEMELPAEGEWSGRQRHHASTLYSM